MNETEAIAAARRHADAFPPYEGRRWEDREWKATRFGGGWLLNPVGEDLAWRTGVVCLVVMDDGQIHQESSSLPPPTLMAKYATEE